MRWKARPGTRATRARFMWRCACSFWRTVFRWPGRPRRTSRPCSAQLPRLLEPGGPGPQRRAGPAAEAFAAAYTPVDATLIPTGEVRGVAGTPLILLRQSPLAERSRRRTRSLASAGATTTILFWRAKQACRTLAERPQPARRVHAHGHHPARRAAVYRQLPGGGSGQGARPTAATAASAWSPSISRMRCTTPSLNRTFCCPEAPAPRDYLAVFGGGSRAGSTEKTPQKA